MVYGLLGGATDVSFVRFGKGVSVMASPQKHVRTYVAGFLLALFLYLLWDGRMVDNYGRSWVWNHASLVLSAIAGLGIRYYVRHAEEKRRNRAVRFSALAALTLVFGGELTSACLLVMLVGPRRVYEQVEPLFPGLGKVLPFAMAILLVAAANPVPLFVGAALVIWLLASMRGSDEPVARSRLQVGWEVFNVFLWLALSAYYLYGQFLNRLQGCASSSVCTGYPYAFVQARCAATCTLYQNLSQDWLYNVSLVIFTITLVRAVELVVAVASGLCVRKANSF